MKIRCLLIDDEPIAQEIIESYIEKIDILEVAGKCRSASEAFTYLQTQNVDLIFLDIQMPEISGLEFIKILTNPNPPKIIITTAFREYAVDGFEMAVLDYLLKPISFDRFLRAIGKMLPTKKDEEGNNIANSNSEPFIFLKEDRKLVKISLNEIIYLESQRDYVKIVTTTKQITTRHTLNYFEELLPSTLFLRIHRSFIAAVPKIESISENAIEVGGKELPIGGNYKQEISRRYKNGLSATQILYQVPPLPKNSSRETT